MDIEVEDDPEPLPELEPLDELPELEPPDELPELDPLDELPELDPLEPPEPDPDELPELEPLPEELPEVEPLEELPDLDPLEELPELDPLEELPDPDPLPEELPELDPLPEELPELLVDAFAMFKNLIELSNFFSVTLLLLIFGLLSSSESLSDMTSSTSAFLPVTVADSTDLPILANNGLLNHRAVLTEVASSANL